MIRKRHILTLLVAPVIFIAIGAAAQPKPKFQKPRPLAVKGNTARPGLADRAAKGKKSVNLPQPGPATSADVDSVRRKTQALSVRIEQLEQALASLQRRSDSVAALRSLPDTAAQSLRRNVAALDVRLGQGDAALKEISAIKLTGYIQFRYSYDDLGPVPDGAAASNALGTTSTAVNGGQGRSLFYVQRGRVRMTCKPAEFSECSFEFDASKTGVSVTDAYIKITEPWTGKKLALTAGQMTWPFGIDIERSNITRELPEPARVTKTLFPGYKDRGLKLTAVPVKNLVCDVGVYNGWGTTNKYFPWDDPTRQKDVLARLKYTAWGTTAAVSYYDGQSYVPRTTTTTANSAGILVSSTQPEHRYYKGRIGVGLESHFRLLKGSETIVLLEAVDGRETGSRVGGGYAQITQYAGGRLSAALRLDTYDRDRRYAYKQDWTSGIGLNYQWDKAVKLSASYEVNRTNMDDRMRHSDPAMAAPDPADNRFTAQMQIKF